MNPFQRYIIRHTRNAQNEPVTEILDKWLKTSSRLYGMYQDDIAIATLEHYRAISSEGIR